jgi:hypothetical protein
VATAKQPKPDWLKAKVRTSRMTMDIDGPLKSALPDLLYMLDTPSREKALKKMQEIHASICEREKEAAKQDAA